MTTKVRRFLLLLPLTLAFSGCPESPDPPQTEVSKASTAPKAPQGAVPLDWKSTLHQIDVADLDGDGRGDLTLSAHVEGLVATYYQQDDRRFLRTDPVDGAGFHPNGTVALPAADGHRYLVLNAEGSSFLRTYRAQRGSAAALVGEVSAPSPNHSVLVEWPAWGPTLAVVSMGGVEIRFYKGFDPRHPDAAPVITAKASPKKFRRLEGLAAADLNGDGTPSVLVTVPREGRLVSTEPAGSDAVSVSEIWQSDPFGFAHVVLPVDFDGDGDDDLFVLGEQMPHASLLLSDGKGGVTEHRFPLEGDGAQSGMASVESDGSLLLWAAGETALVVLRWGKDRAQEPERFVLERPGSDWIRFAGDDLDGDGHPDLVIGSSVGHVPPTVVFGPLGSKVDAIGTWFSALKREVEARRRARKSRGETAAEPQGSDDARA